MKRILLSVSIMMMVAVLIAVFSTPAAAKVTGRCDN